MCLRKFFFVKQIFTSIVLEAQVGKYRELSVDSKVIREDSRARHERRAMRSAMYRKENNHTVCLLLSVQARLDRDKAKRVFRRNLRAVTQPWWAQSFGGKATLPLCAQHAQTLSPDSHVRLFTQFLLVCIFFYIQYRRMANTTRLY